MYAPTYNRRQIMLRAWELVKRLNGWETRLAFELRRALWRAWSEAKEAVRKAGMSETDRIRESLSLMENKDRWSRADYDKAEKLRADLRTAQDHEKAETVYAEKRALIAAAAGRFCSVTFTKKDGTERTIRVQPATLRGHVKGKDASEAGRKASLTRVRRHPHLLPVWDAEANAPRSVNLATVSRIAANGQVHTFI